ncbi:ATP-binding protein [Candidatus Azambacteria bacterium]|nr:ATP-binding protein [Candidatus Azambacteria bacterium]
MSDRDIEFLEKLMDDADIIFIDEGQKVKTIGQTIKLLVDHYKEKKQVLVTGSSSFNLLDKTQEALTGRKRVYNLYPLSFPELYPKKDRLQIAKELETHLIYGSYPDVINQKGFSEKREALEELASSQLYRDILEFIVFRLPPYFSNKRKEITKLKKIYFFDVGIRNILINNLNLLDTRSDAGALWENFLIAERMKKRAYEKIHSNQYFWRTYDQKEIDLIEERDGKLYGYEFKWNAKKRSPKAPKDWLEAYSNSSYEVITLENYFDFIL